MNARSMLGRESPVSASAAASARVWQSLVWRDSFKSCHQKEVNGEYNSVFDYEYYVQLVQNWHLIFRTKHVDSMPMQVCGQTAHHI